MWNLFKRFFGGKYSNTEKNVETDNEVAEYSEPEYTVDGFKKAIETSDMDLIVAYVESGANVNAVIMDTVIEWNGPEMKYNYICYRPLDFVRNSEVEKYLREHGALTSEELWQDYKKKRERAIRIKRARRKRH